MDLGTWALAIREASALAMLVFIYACARQWVVYGWVFRMLEKDRDEWKARALECEEIRRGLKPD